MGTKNNEWKIRFAQTEDIPLILAFIKELAEYEQLLDEVVATEEVLRESLFEKKIGEVIIAEIQGNPVGFALFFHNFSTFLGKPGIYLEDLFIRLGWRGRGIGRSMLSFLANVTIERNCGRLEWWCLDWNQESIDFYKHLGAEAMEDWTVYRLTDQNLKKLADRL